MHGKKKWFMGLGKLSSEITSINTSHLRDKELLKKNKEQGRPTGSSGWSALLLTPRFDSHMGQ